jgi:hypothetical protein
MSEKLDTMRAKASEGTVRELMMTHSPMKAAPLLLALLAAGLAGGTDAAMAQPWSASA